MSAIPARKGTQPVEKTEDYDDYTQESWSWEWAAISKTGLARVEFEGFCTAQIRGRKRRNTQENRDFLLALEAIIAHIYNRAFEMALGSGP